ncbi:hypothetical protein QCB44_06630 [Thiomicrorhabdus sp. zzn3]|uniref:hypothetical protein n=1 Tax=Thiomicrorhabdus sp. zzn3 TaxID=3039775 RepID=UPI002436857F|nr:hypothetical protein [Thiomicrorhabdus sp. zzn3]MDG6778373.1 hypothetical protein [Thiomicrorhabdus sp. zzn3]
MKSTITVRSTFDFRGETFCYEADIDLPSYVDDVELFLQQLPNRIAKQNQMDVISYKFEMLESSEIEVIRFQSRIASAIPNLPMRVETFLDLYQKVGPEAYLQNIAENHQLDLDANPQIAKALKAAYELGKEHRPKEKPVTHHWW